ncbi:glycoside hydrolase family 3 protein [Demequina iriomotensis]|uniref:glycoside hydrolase family 3 protein n=1 Tax=Demequina iriomotensis TaxID=1536641 RepID=UPI0007830045|nr:glycoside hydrolase family 3 protein [Demequina iriomotensis]
MATRKEIKQEAVARVKDERAARQARKAELEAMTPDERTAAKAADKTAARAAQAAAKAERAEVRPTLNRAQRRELKRRERVYRKVKHRPRRAIGWGVTGAAVIGLGALAAPYVGDISTIASLTFTDETPEAVAAREAAAGVAESISDEGIVLLKNDADLLPLDGGVNVFSFAAYNLILGGSGSGGASGSETPTLFEALEAQGVDYNTDLDAATRDAGAKHEAASGNFVAQMASTFLGGDEGEPAPDYLTDDVLAQAQAFSDTAIVVVGASGTEASDLTQEDLQLSAEQRALLDKVTAVQDHVIVVVNSGNQMELGFLDEYPEIDAALWIGTPGPQGATSLAKVLTGEVNPSGRLVDTYAYDVSTAPGAENLGDHDYTNVKRSFLDYEEGIYVGYRYYETRFEGDEDGYLDTVQFPFGYGLSYTDFSWDVAEAVVSDNAISVDVTVTNDGDVAGKDVVEVYFSAPYTGAIEKSSIELAGYAKTSELAPGASETVTVEFAIEDMASWDTAGGRYLLEAGDYAISARTDVHTAVASSTVSVADDVVIDADPDTGTAYESRFDYVEGDLTFLSRADWEGTYPTAPDGTETASDEVLALMDPTYEPAEGEAPTYGADNGLQLSDMVGIDLDDPQWDAFLDQLTLDEQIALFSQGAYSSLAIDRLGIPSITLLDSPAGLNSLFSPLDSAAYPNEAVVGATWNDALAYALGESVAAEAKAYGVDVWYAPGMNLHRTAMGGRDFEYFSEDPLLTGKMAAAMVSGSEDNGVLTTIKHFVLNDQEVNARTGINVFASEQALRELYLEPFEIAAKDADPSGAMSSFINIGGSWAGGNADLLQGVLRDEWGFDGFVTTDAVLGGWMNPEDAARAGNDWMLAVLPTASEGTLKKAVDADPVGLGADLRDRVRTILATVARSTAMDAS